MKASQINIVKTLAKNENIVLNDKEAKKAVQQILDNTDDYYICGDRDEETRDDDFYYDAKDYFTC